MLMRRKTVVEIVYFDAGGGHRSAMRALSGVLAARHPDWIVKPVDLQKLLEPVDPIHRTTKLIVSTLQNVLEPMATKLNLAPMQAQDVYNAAHRRGIKLGMKAALPLLIAFIDRFGPEIKELLRAHWRSHDHAPDLVVSMVPNFNGVMFEALRVAQPQATFVTVMTDMVDCPPHYWMEAQDQFLICGSPTAFGQALASGFYDRKKLFRVSGMILKPAFYERPSEPRFTHEDLGLSPDRSTALIMFGGNGSLGASLDIVNQLHAAEPAIQTIVMCGNNGELLDSLQGVARCHAVGPVAQVADHMRLADLFIGKPGPGSLSEAAHMGLPMVVECNANTVVQERPNADWVRDNDIGVVVGSFRRDIVAAVRHVLCDLDRYKRNLAENIPPNRAVFEVAAIVERLAHAEAHQDR